MPLSDYGQLYADAGTSHGVDPHLLMAQGEAEDASGDPKAVGPATKYGHARGVAQLIPATAASLGVTDPTDPKQAIEAQARLMAENLKRYKDPHTAVLAYHGGTDPNNWGPKTHAYAGKVMENYQKLSSNDDDPLAMRANQTDLNPEISFEDHDPLEARSQQSETTSSLKAPEKDKKIGVAEDLAKTIPSAVVKGIGAIPQIPAMAGNAFANAMGYTYGKLAAATPEQQEKLNNLNPFFTGNTTADALVQAGHTVSGEDPGAANPLTGSVLHDPQTTAGRFANALTQGAIAGPASGLKLLPAVTGAAGAQAASEGLPNNPLAPLLGGLAGGSVAPIASALKLRYSPEDVAHNVIKDISGTGELQPNSLTPHEIIPGSKPTLAQVTNDPNIAVLERQARDQNSTVFRDFEKANEDARKEHFENASGTPQDVQTIRDERNEAVEPLYEQARVQALDPKAIHPVFSKIDNAIKEVGEGSDAGKTLMSIKQKIAGAMPSNTGLKNKTQSPLIQIFREERDRLEKPSHTEGAYAATVKSVIKPIIHQLGDAIESQSEPFAKAQQIYREKTPFIKSMEWMQGLKLTNASGQFTLAKVKNALDNAKKLQKIGGIKGKGVSTEQLDSLQKLHDDLERRDSVSNASMPKGSPTSQNMLAAAAMKSGLAGKTNKLLGGRGPEIVGSAAGSTLGAALGMPGFGSFAGNMVGRSINEAGSKRSAAATANLQNYLLNPENYKQYLLDQKDNTFANRFGASLLK